MKTWLFTKLFRLLRSDFLALAGSLILVTAAGFLIWSRSSQFPLAVPLWFFKPLGEGRLAAPIFLWLVPIIGLSTILVNFTLAYFFSTRERLLSLLLFGSSLIVCSLLFYSLLNIILVTT